MRTDRAPGTFIPSPEVQAAADAAALHVQRSSLLRPSTEPEFVETFPGCFVNELPPTDDIVLQLLHRVAVLEAQVSELREGRAS